jgi:hypothetical protein
MSAYYAPITGTRIIPARGYVKDRLACPRCGIDYNPRNTRDNQTRHTHCKDCRDYQNEAAA